MNINRIVKNVLPAIVVLAAGLFGMNFIYNTYMKDGSSSVISLEPAAGEDATAPAEVTSEVTTESTVSPDGATMTKTDCATVTSTKSDGTGDGVVAAENGAVSMDPNAKTATGTDCITTTTDTQGTEGESADMTTTTTTTTTTTEDGTATTTQGTETAAPDTATPAPETEGTMAPAPENDTAAPAAD
jgi:hypothetical protein